ncbi:MAG: hypothetical protein ACREHG_07480, partial [Candidatus Saccharimonadales bacterium]
WLLWRRQIRWQAFYRVFSCLVLGVILGEVVQKLLAVTGVIVDNSYAQISFVSFSNLPEEIYWTFGTVLQFFGGFFFGSPIKLSYGGLVVSFIFFVVVLGVAFRLARRYIHTHEQRHLPVTFVPLALIATSIMLLIFYIVTSRPTAGDSQRYLSILPFVAVILVIARSKAWRHGSLLLVSCLILLGGLMNSYHGWFSYQATAFDVSRQVSLTKNIVSYLEKQKVPVVFGGYSHGATTRFYASGKVMAYSFNAPNHPGDVLAYSGWYKPQANVHRSAIIYDTYFDDLGKGSTFETLVGGTAALHKIYGPPASQKLAGYHSGKPVYVLIYNYDIRTKFVGPPVPQDS